MREYTQEAYAFYKSKAWELCRETYLSKVGGLCERCFENGEIRPAKIVHHKNYISTENINNPQVTLNHDNLEALCQDCHNKEHIRHKRRYEIGADGELLMRDL